MNIAPVSNRPIHPEKALAFSKRIDYVLGLPPSSSEQSAIRKYFCILTADEQSLNQALTSIPELPIFLDIEVQKGDPRDPLIQAWIWCAAGVKKLRMGWTTELPMPVVIVKEDYWVLYIGSFRGNKLVTILILYNISLLTEVSRYLAVLTISGQPWTQREFSIF